MILALLLAAAIAQASPTSGEASGDAVWAQRTQASMDIWKLCVVGTAKKWARQSAEPTSIAEGAIGHCAPQLNDVSATLRSSPYLRGADADELIRKLKSTWRERAIATVLETRAAKAR